jgi:hypothetical protein
MIYFVASIFHVLIPIKQPEQLAESTTRAKCQGKLNSKNPNLELIADKVKILQMKQTQ